MTQEVFTKVDPVTGRPTYDPERKPRTGSAVTFCPGLWGGKDWTPAGYNPKTNYLYIPANENLCSTLTGLASPYEPGKLFLGVDRPKISMSWPVQWACGSSRAEGAPMLEVRLHWPLAVSRTAPSPSAS